MIKNFFSMGGYAMYVWPAYGIALLILLGNGLAAWIKYRRLLKKK